jgi:hypothetical protein
MWGLAMNMIYFILAVVLFQRMFESARARGLLVKMQ